MRKSRLLVAALLGACVPGLGALVGVDAVVSVGVIVAGPGAQTVGYLSRTVISPPGMTVLFENADVVNQHNVVSATNGPDGAPLFRSPIDTLYLPDPVEVAGTESLEPGSYPFFCSLHPNMTGTLIIGRPSDPPPAPPPGPFVVPMPVPPVRTGSDIALKVQEADVAVLPGAPPTHMYTYDGMFPGPTIRRPAGSPTRVTFTNTLPPAAGEATVHRHGGHDASAEDGQPDRELIASGASRTYTYDLMEGGAPERAAFEWYHDHRLDRTGENLWRGLAGMFIVDDAVDAALPLPKGEFDVPIMLAERSFDEYGQLTDPSIGRTPPGDEVTGELVLVNGRHLPFFDVGDRSYRFRFLNASNFSLYELRLSNGAPLVQIGTESGLLPAPVVRNSILLGPAERAEVVIDFDRMLGQDVVLETIARSDGGGVLGLGAGSKVGPLMQFRVTRDLVDDATVPATLRALPPLDAPRIPALNRHWIAGVGFDAARSGTAWTFNGRPYRQHDVAARPVIGTTETWLLANPTSVSHVVHIHGTDFRVLSRNGRKPRPWEAGLKDTFLLDPGDVLTVAARFTDHRGTFLVHCHMLEHEDHGMMAQYEVVGATAASTAAAESTGPPTPTAPASPGAVAWYCPLRQRFNDAVHRREVS